MTLKTKLLLVLIFTIFLLLGILPFISIGRLSTEGEHLIYISSSDIHTGFLFPKNEAGPFLDFLPIKHFTTSSFEGIDFSFGDRQFFEKVPNWKDLTIPIGLDALFTPENGLMHVDLYTDQPQKDSSLKKLYLNEEQYVELINFIKNSFKKQDGQLVQYKNLSYYGTDRFFYSSKRYYFLYTCNSWTGEGLRTIDVRTGILTPHPWGVLFHLP